MLIKLVSTKKVGCFRNSVPSDHTQLRRRSFIVDPDGYGKLRTLLRESTHRHYAGVRNNPL